MASVNAPESEWVDDAERADELKIGVDNQPTKSPTDALIHDLKLAFEMEVDFVADLRVELARRDDEIAKLRAEVAHLRQRLEYKQGRLNRVKDQLKELKGVAYAHQSTTN